MTVIKKGTETDNTKCPKCKQPIILPDIVKLAGKIMDDCPWCKKRITVE